MPEVRRLLQAVGEAEELQARRLRWSHFRRQHQGRAQCFHRLRRARQAPAVSVNPPAPLRLLGVPARFPSTGSNYIRSCPHRSQRRAVPPPIIASSWKACSGSHVPVPAFRELPERFGPWSTVASRYQRWLKEGLWTRILHVLLPSELRSCPRLEPFKWDCSTSLRCEMLKRPDKRAESHLRP
jgi:hypothetical protein